MKQHALAGEPIEGRRFHDRIAVHARVGPAPVVGDGEEDIRPGVFGRGNSCLPNDEQATRHTSKGQNGRGGSRQVTGQWSHGTQLQKQFLMGGKNRTLRSTTTVNGRSHVGKCCCRTFLLQA